MDKSSEGLSDVHVGNFTRVWRQELLYELYWDSNREVKVGFVDVWDCVVANEDMMDRNLRGRGLAFFAEMDCPQWHFNMPPKCFELDRQMSCQVTHRVDKRQVVTRNAWKHV